MRAPLALLAAALLMGCGSADEAPAAGAEAPPLPEGPDIWLAEMRSAGDGGLVVGEPFNATERAGYDNQPHFLPDGSGLWYTVIDDAGQADIWRYDLASRTSNPVTRTAPESEYSATPIPGESGFSAIRVEADSTQRLWRFDADGENAAVLLPDLAPVGYQAWASERTLALFVLGSPPTLRLADVRSGGVRTVAEDIGRSLHAIPGEARVSWVQRVGDGTTEIRALDPVSGESTLLVTGVGGREDHAWTPDGWLLQAEGGVVHAWREGSAGWIPIVDVSRWHLDVSRLAVSPDGRWLAMVAEPRATP